MIAENALTLRKIMIHHSKAQRIHGQAALALPTLTPAVGARLLSDHLDGQPLPTPAALAATPLPGGSDGEARRFASVALRLFFSDFFSDFIFF